jgi:putative ABC transport system permease protein
MGLTQADALAIKNIVPGVQKVCPEITIETSVLQNAKRLNTKLSGVTLDYFEVFNMSLQSGKLFSDYQMSKGLPVCIVGSDIQTKLFNNKNPVGQYLKCGHEWLLINGVMEKRDFADNTKAQIGFSNTNGNVYIPLKTMLLRYKNRALVTPSLFSGGIIIRGNIVIDEESLGDEDSKNHNQLDRLVVQVKETPQVLTVKQVVERLLLRRHYNVADFEVTVPELMLKQEQKTRTIFNVVLGAIAGISLLVGGIGIMNIMLASVMERIREIGTRQALGATRKDILVQFLAESVLISLTGGFSGIILGIVMSGLITRLAGIHSSISLLSVLLAFVISVSVGILFGYLPAKNASEKDPIESLRYE